MKLVTKTLSKVVWEIKDSEIKRRGFLNIWDDIRKMYPVDEYDMDNIGPQGNEDLIFIELKSKKIM